ncbi:MAG: hypothetical protein M1815_003418 [Lichina confinis]|nr:MAG: hypothetical protein M1815_003418 [Lichina confinis]
MAEPDGITNLVVLGGGVIGCSVAYYLTSHPSYDPTLHRVTLLEATKIAGGASGKAGGLLARWAYPSSIVPLSFRLHAELAEEHDGERRWGYRRVHSSQINIKARPKRTDAPRDGASAADAISLRKREEAARDRAKTASIPKDLDWVLPENVIGYEEIGGPDTTAQVHPHLFTTSMAQLAESQGARVVLGSATKLNYDSNGVQSVTYVVKGSEVEETVPANFVVLSAGPWTRSLYPSAPISALRAHSVTIRPSRPVSAYALFTEITLPATWDDDGRTSTGKKSRASKRVSPEIYARPNNEVYACGEGDTLVPVPESTDLVQVDDSRCQAIVDYVFAVSDELRDGEVTARQACYLPNVTGPTSGPLVGETGVKGLLMATGHTCWGIQNAPATGKLISELIFDGKAKSANISQLDPRRVL